MKKHIIDKLKSLERENDITILYACESGSRAWGFDNVESDYDVRFIYKRNNLREYLTLSDKSDVIEYSGDNIDIVGWDIKKALKLHYSGNPNLREWLLSPIKYINWDTNIFEGLEEFDMAKLKYHYTSIAVNNWKKLSRNDSDLTKRDLKMLLYNCRCVLIWNVIDQGDDPSINVSDLLGQVKNLDDDIACDINSLISFYKHNCQDDLNPDAIGNIKQWMGYNLTVMRRDLPKTDDSRNFDRYDERFFELLLPGYDNSDKQTLSKALLI